MMARTPVQTGAVSGLWAALPSFALSVFLCGGRLFAADAWHVQDAPLRYKLNLGRKPTHPSAGYFASLPDGGIIRGSAPGTTVTTESGKVLASHVLWYNPETGFSVVFATPESAPRAVYVYVKPGMGVRVWKPDSGLTPSMIVCAAVGRDTLSAAQGLATLGRVEPSVHWAEDAGHPRTPLDIGGDLTGRSKPAAFYLLAHVVAPVAGSYWVAPVSSGGPSELWIDGAKIPLREKSKAWAGTGAVLELSKGLHRVEALQAAPGSGPYTDAPWYLTWRPPNEQLSGVEARVLKPSEVVRSGLCSFAAVESRDGFPVASGRVTPGFVYWFGNEEPLVVCEFDSSAAAAPPGSTFTWTFQEGVHVEGPRARWIFPGYQEGRARLTVKSGDSVSSCLVPFFTFSHRATSLNNAEHRKIFRDTLGDMVAAYPKNTNLIAGWSDAWWNNIIRTVEAGQGTKLMTHLFGEHFESVRKRLPKNQLDALQDTFLDVVLRDLPEENFTWIKKFFLGAADPARQNELRFREGELHMYYLNDRKRAENLYTVLAATPGGIGERSKIRLGDLALLSGDLNKATSFYADVQNRARTARNTGPVDYGSTVAGQLLRNKPNAALPAERSLFDQKDAALQEVSLSENARTLMAGGFLLEAQQVLEVWEAQFPLSKVSGDYILREAALFVKLRDWKRAQQMLEAYCREIDASSYLPEAVSLLIQCVEASQSPSAGIRGIVEKVKGRLKFHPIASKLDAFLEKAGPAPKESPRTP